MDKNSIIDKESFEVCTHAEDHPKVFVCDKLIAPAVALLNKKGYKTFASCSGHYKIEFYEYLNEDICQFSNDASASSFGQPFSLAPAINLSRKARILSTFFLDISFTNLTPSPKLNFPTSRAICASCSW